MANDQTSPRDGDEILFDPADAGPPGVARYTDPTAGAQPYRVPAPPEDEAPTARLGLTVGSLIDTANQIGDETEGVDWSVQRGRVSRGGGKNGYTSDGVVQLDYNNPYGQRIERVWFDGRIVYAVECGQVDAPLETLEVAQEYQIVYDVELNADGKPAREPEKVPGQYNIYDTVPGMKGYSPLWRFNYVIVPRNYRINSLRSEADCLNSGYPLVPSTYVEN